MVEKYGHLKTSKACDLAYQVVYKKIAVLDAKHRADREALRQAGVAILARQHVIAVEEHRRKQE